MQQISIKSLWFHQNTRYTALETRHANHYTTDAVVVGSSGSNRNGTKYSVIIAPPPISAQTFFFHIYMKF